ncbi:MAG: tail fiber domain-containing protein [Chitinophagales bacterium]|nr:tail fiber domain-containing protein [Chitinophagales bacterium]
MKKYTLLFSLALGTATIQAQNVFPETGNVGIGTLTPSHPLDILPGVDTVVIGLGNSIINSFPYSTGFGKDVLSQNTTGVYNTTMGYEALAYNLTGFGNAAFGTLALANNLSGSINVAIGSTAMQQNTTGNQNVAVGYGALFENKGGTDNIGIGYNAMLNNRNASNNVAVGSSALGINVKGNNNTALGYFSLYQNTKGNDNTAMGNNALWNNTLGNYNSALGSETDVTVNNLSNTTAIGYNTIVDASNKIAIGNSSVSSIGGQVDWTVYSDARIKEHVEENVPGLAFINRLRPVTYNYNIKTQDQLMGRTAAGQWTDKYAIQEMSFSGFIAQEVAAAAKDLGYAFSGVDESGQLMGLRYATFVVPLVKAVQELSIENEGLKEAVQEINKENQYLKYENENFESRITQLEKLISKQGIVLNVETAEEIYKQLAVIESETATLAQNVPNPFTGTTSIAYYVPETAQQAHIKIANATGVALFMAEVRLGNGVLEADATQLATGTYSYTLLVDGKVVDTKLMVIQ